jgi:hypothetical protein
MLMVFFCSLIWACVLAQRFFTIQASADPAEIEDSADKKSV